MGSRIKIRDCFTAKGDASASTESIASRKHSALLHDKRGRNIRIFRDVYARAHAVLFLGIVRADEYTPNQAVLEDAATKRETWERFVTRMRVTFQYDALDACHQRGLPVPDISNADFARKKMDQNVSVFSSPVGDGAIYAIAFDYDKIGISECNDMMSRLYSAPYELIAHTTTSHTEEAPKVHVIVPLARPIRTVDLKYAISHLIDVLELPTCFDSSVFHPGWSLFIPQVRKTQGFLFVNDSVHTATGVVPYRFDFEKHTKRRANEEALARYGSFLGGIANKYEANERVSLPITPTTFNGGMRLLSQNETLPALSLSFGAHRPRPHYIEYANDRDFLRRSRAFDAVSAKLVEAFREVQVQYAAGWASDKIHGIKARTNNNTMSPKLLSLVAPCPRCSARKEKRDMFGFINLITGYMELTCASTSCGHRAEIRAPFYAYGSNTKQALNGQGSQAYVIDVADVMFRFFSAIGSHPISHIGRDEYFIKHKRVMVSLRSVFASLLDWRQLSDFDAFINTLPIPPVSCVLDSSRFPTLSDGSPSFGRVTHELASLVSSALPNMSKGTSVRRASKIERLPSRGGMYIISNEAPELYIANLLSQMQYPFGIDFRSLSNLRAPRWTDDRNYNEHVNSLIRGLGYAILPIKKVQKFLEDLPPVVIFKVPEGLHRASEAQSALRARQMINMIRMRGSYVLLLFASSISSDNVTVSLEKLGIRRSVQSNAFNTKRIGMRFRKAEESIEDAGKRARAACRVMQEAGLPALRKAFSELATRKYETKKVSKRTKKSIKKRTKQSIKKKIKSSK